MKKIMFFGFLFLFISCDDISKSEVSQKIDKKCDGLNCEIKMDEIVSEPWETMYIFNLNMSLDEINRQLGFEYPYFEDIANRIVFVKGDKIVYHEDEFPNSEKTKKGELIFDIGDTKFSKIDRNKAVFQVRRERNFFKLKLKI